MKKFKFRLEKILQYRLLVKQEKLREVKFKHQILLEEEEKLNWMLEEQVKDRVSHDQLYQVDELALLARYSERLSSEIIMQKERVEIADSAYSKAKDDYIEASKEASALEKLREKRLEQHNQEVFKSEESFLDELVVQKPKVNFIEE